MAEVFIYKDYNLIEEIKKLLIKGYNTNSYEASYKVLRDGLNELKDAISKAAEISLKE